MRNGQTENQRKDADNNYIPTPEFEELVELAIKDPQGFEQLRKDLCQRVINEAPIEMQHRLNGMQFTIDMERERSSNSLAACIKFSSMMNDSLHELKQAIANPKEYLSKQENAKKQSAEVIQLFPNSKE